MIKRIAPVAVLLLLTVACASVPMNSSSSAGAATVPGVATNPATAPDYILLTSPSQVRTYDYNQPVYGFHVRGTFTSRGFVPAGEVQGRGDFCADGRDWYSFSDLKVHKAGEGTPTGAHLLGCANGSGFKPASRQIAQ